MFYSLWEISPPYKWIFLFPLRVRIWITISWLWEGKETTQTNCRFFSPADSVSMPVPSDSSSPSYLLLQGSALPKWKAIFARNVIKALEHNYQLFSALQTQSLCGNHSLPNHIDGNISLWNPFLSCICQWLLCEDFSGCHCSRMIREEVEKDKETEENWEKRKQKINLNQNTKPSVLCGNRIRHM